MTCWDNCGYTWRAIGESTNCTRDINDGTVVNARLTVEVTDIRYDPSLEEDVDHQFDGIVKIYQLYDGDIFETLVYESVDTFHYSSCKIYYKYNEWKVCLHDIIESPAEVNIKISHKALCPDCSHPYICDCEDTIGWEDWSITYAPAATNNPDPETIHVKLLDVETGGLSIRVEIEIWRDSIIVYTNSSVVINISNYIDISDSGTEHDWRVACNDIPSSISATVQLCFSFSDSGEGSGSTGSGLLVAQYFDSTAFGWTGGCVIWCKIENPKSGGGENTVPTEIELDLYEWQGNYTDTINSTSLTTCTMITPSEILEDSYFYVPFIWNIDIPPGEYIWTLKCLYGPHDGSFNVMYQGNAKYSLYPCWVNGYSHYAATSRILGIESERSWEGVLCVDDTFYSGNYAGYGGYSNIKINSNSDYKNIISSKIGCNYIKAGVGDLTPDIPVGRLVDNSSDVIIT